MDTNQSIKYFGVYPIPYGGVPEWRDLSFQLGRLYRDRVATLPWIPSNWEAVVMPAMTGNTESYMIAPSKANYADNGKMGYGAVFLDTPEKKQVWDEIAQTASKVLTDYAAGQVAAGRQEMEQAYNNTKFWDAAVNVANLAAAPLNLLTDTAEFYTKFKGLISAVVVIGGIGFAIHSFTRKR